MMKITLLIIFYNNENNYENKG